MTCPPVPPPAMMTRMVKVKIYHGDTRKGCTQADFSKELTYLGIY